VTFLSDFLHHEQKRSCFFFTLISFGGNDSRETPLETRLVIIGRSERARAQVRRAATATTRAAIYAREGRAARVTRQRA